MLFFMLFWAIGRISLFVKKFCINSKLCSNIISVRGIYSWLHSVKAGISKDMVNLNNKRKPVFCDVSETLAN